jgi:hypothetical protein
MWWDPQYKFAFGSGSAWWIQQWVNLAKLNLNVLNLGFKTYITLGLQLVLNETNRIGDTKYNIYYSLIGLLYNFIRESFHTVIQITALGNLKLGKPCISLRTVPFVRVTQNKRGIMLPGFPTPTVQQIVVEQRHGISPKGITMNLSKSWQGKSWKYQG